MTANATQSTRALWISLIQRLVLVIAGVMLLVTVGAYLGISRHERDTLVNGKVTAAKMVANFFVSSSAPAVVFADTETLANDVKDLAKDRDVVDVEVWLRAPGSAEASLLVHFNRDGLEKRRIAPATFSDSVTIGETDVVVVRPINNPEGITVGGGKLVFSLSPEISASQATTRRILWIASILGLLVAGVLVLAVGRSLLRPMRELRMARELEIATNIQQAMLPTKPAHPEFEIGGRMLPADEVGGDFFDVLTSERALWITIGDVSGHGIGAGLIMLMVQSAFAMQFRMNPKQDPNCVMGAVNHLLWENITERLRENKYVTCQLLAYAGDGVFRVAGGHQWPLVYRAASKTVERIDASGPWLGILQSWPEVATLQFTLEQEDVLCLYSDGLIEARDELGNLYDATRFVESLRAAIQDTPSLEAAIERVLHDSFSFCPKPDDDVSVVLLRRRETC
ncbi:MAG: SpoIIE family protein phosphatase [Polyangiaceae bacterium]